MTDQELAAIEDRLAKGGFSNWDAEKLIAALREIRELTETASDVAELGHLVREWFSRSGENRS